MHRIAATIPIMWLVLSVAACQAPNSGSQPHRSPLTVTAPALEPEAPAAQPAAGEPEPDGEPTPQRGPVSLRTAIARALDENPDLQATRARIDAAEASLSEAKSAFRPYLGLDLDYLYADAPSLYLFKTIDQGRFVQGTDFNDPGSFDNLELGATLRWNLYNGGRDRAQREMSEHELDIRSLEASAVRNALVAGVVEAWYDVRAAEDQARTAERSTATVAAQLEDARARFDAGVVLESDVLSLEVRLAEAEELAIRATNARALALAALARLLGDTDAGELELGFEEPLPARLPETYPAAVELALAERPELERARRVVGRAELGVDEARGGILPRADLYARVYGDTPEFDAPDRTNWVAGIALTWDAYMGGSRNAGVDRARAGLREMMQADRSATLSVQLDVKSAWLRREEALARLEVAGAAVGQAEQSLALVRDQYEGGTATVTRYLEAELMTTQARMRATKASFDLKKSEADLARALGQYRDAPRMEEGS